VSFGIYTNQIDRDKSKVAHIIQKKALLCFIPRGKSNNPQHTDSRFWSKLYGNNSAGGDIQLQVGISVVDP
jgi:hypothetical protein